MVSVSKSTRQVRCGVSPEQQEHRRPWAGDDDDVGRRPSAVVSPALFWKRERSG